MEITYRKPEPDEAEAFAALHVQCWRECYSDILPAALMATFSTQMRLPMWQAALVNNERFVMGAYSDGHPCGFVISGPSDQKNIPEQDGHLWALYIAASHHRLGIGKRLFIDAVQHWLGQGGHSMTVGVFAENRRARAFYEHLGAEMLHSGIYQWGGFDLPDCFYIWRDLAKIGNI